jgi:hypothetical protein
VQLATVQLSAAGKALVADVKAKNVDASPVDLLRIVKARRSVGCAGVPHRSPGEPRTWEYSSTPRVL